MHRSIAKGCARLGQRSTHDFPCGLPRGLSYIQKVQVLRKIAFPSMAWPSGTRHWAIVELRGLRTLQCRMTRRLARWWPRGHDDRGTARREGALLGQGCCHHLVEVGWPPPEAARERAAAWERKGCGVAKCVVAQDVARRVPHRACSALTMYGSHVLSAEFDQPCSSYVNRAVVVREKDKAGRVASSLRD